MLELFIVLEFDFLMVFKIIFIVIAQPSAQMMYDFETVFVFPTL